MEFTIWLFREIGFVFAVMGIMIVFMIPVLFIACFARTGVVPVKVKSKKKKNKHKNKNIRKRNDYNRLIKHAKKRKVKRQRVTHTVTS